MLVFSLDSAKTFVEADWEGEVTSAVKQLKEKCWCFSMNYQDILKRLLAGWGSRM